jgi:RNA polymerase-binding transcription factor DksA
MAQQGFAARSVEPHTQRAFGIAERRQRSALSASELAAFGAALREQREFRVTQLAELAGPDPDSTVGPEVAQALREAARHALGEIDGALVRLHAGRYGRCASCDRAISRERLEVLPAAALCMICQHALAAE